MVRDTITPDVSRLEIPLDGRVSLQDVEARLRQLADEIGNLRRSYGKDEGALRVLIHHEIRRSSAAMRGKTHDGQE